MQRSTIIRTSVTATIGIAIVASVVATRAQDRGGAAQPIDYRVLATLRTGTLEKELNEGAEAGFRFQAVMGGETAFGGKEGVAVMSRVPGNRGRYSYRLLATLKTSTMEKELQEAAEAGYEYRDQTVFETALGGREVAVIMERDKNAEGRGNQYKLFATLKTSTLQKELEQAGNGGYELVGMTVGKTAFGGKELVAITKRPR
jgi:hypothetical protein